LAKVHDYLVGSQLDEALEADQDIIVSWPFADGDIRDWTQAEALWYVCNSIVVPFLS
jgi:actin-related protein 9